MLILNSFLNFTSEDKNLFFWKGNQQVFLSLSFSNASSVSYERWAQIKSKNRLLQNLWLLAIHRTLARFGHNGFRFHAGPFLRHYIRQNAELAINIYIFMWKDADRSSQVKDFYQGVEAFGCINPFSKLQEYRNRCPPELPDLQETSNFELMTAVLIKTSWPPDAHRQDSSDCGVPRLCMTQNSLTKLKQTKTFIVPFA